MLRFIAATIHGIYSSVLNAKSASSRSLRTVNAAYSLINIYLSRSHARHQHKLLEWWQMWRSDVFNFAYDINWYLSRSWELIKKTDLNRKYPNTCTKKKTQEFHLLECKIYMGIKNYGCRFCGTKIQVYVLSERLKHVYTTIGYSRQVV